jgi:hypothetical protein
MEKKTILILPVSKQILFESLQFFIKPEEKNVHGSLEV